MREICPICGARLTVEYNYNGCTHQEYFVKCDRCHFYEKGFGGIYEMGIENKDKYKIVWTNLHPPTGDEKRSFKRKMWRYRKSLVRRRKIKGRGKMGTLWRKE